MDLWGLWKNRYFNHLNFILFKYYSDNNSFVASLIWWVPDGNPSMNPRGSDLIYIWPFSYLNHFSFLSLAAPLFSWHSPLSLLSSFPLSLPLFFIGFSPFGKGRIHISFVQHTQQKNKYGRLFVLLKECEKY